MSTYAPKTESFRALWKEELGEMPSYIPGGILPKGGFFLFGGEPGVGKSLFILNLMRRIMGQRPSTFPAYPALALGDKCERALYLDAEVGRHGLWERVKGIFDTPPPHGFVYTTETSELTLDTEAGRGRLKKLIDTAKPEIVIVDPVSSFMAGSDSDNSNVADFFRTLRWLQEQQPDPLTFILCHHFRKKPSEREDWDPLDLENFRGATKWISEAWTILPLADIDRSKRSVKARWGKVRHGPQPEGTWRFRFDENQRMVEQVPGRQQAAVRKRRGPFS